MASLEEIDRLAPYRIEWRPNLVTRWGLLRTAATHDEALEAMRAEAKKHSGYTRVVVQHVIERHKSAVRP
jgi:hypothetical protein